MRTELKGEMVVSHSFNCAESYEIDEESCSLVESGVLSCWNLKYVSL